MDGIRIILFNIHEGVLGEFFVKGSPITRGPGRAIELVPVSGGESRYRYLYDLGVEPNQNGFNSTNFTVVAQDRASLPPVRERGYPRPNFS